MIKNKTSLIKGKFFRNIITLVSGTAVAQIVGLFFIPFITRLYGPEAFGVLGYYSSLLSLLTPLAALCYPLALMLPKRRSEALALFELSLKIASVISITIGALIFIFEYCFPNKIPFENSYFLIPAGVFSSFWMLAYTQWAIKYGRFRLVASLTVITAFGSALAKILIGYFYPSAVTLINISIITLLLNVLVLSLGLTVGIKLSNIIKIRKRHLFIARKYIRFPIYRTPHAMMAVISQTAPVFLLTYFYGANYAGYFVLTRTVLSAPVTLIGKAVYDVSYPKIAQNYNKNQPNSKFVINSTLGLFALSMFPLVIIFLFSGSVFSFLFGAEWETSGIYAAWIAPWFAFNFSNKVAAAAVSVYNMDDFLFRNSVLNMFLSGMGFFIGMLYFKSDIASVALFSTLGIVAQVLLITKIIRIIKISDQLKSSEIKATKS